jgi:septal ring factor EnvC (AmiA/AmiB activator)
MASGNPDYRKLESLIYTTGAHDRLLKHKEDEIGKKLTKLKRQMEELEKELQDVRDKKKEKDDELEAFLASLAEEKKNEVLRQKFREDHTMTADMKATFMDWVDTMDDVTKKNFLVSRLWKS